MPWDNIALQSTKGEIKFSENGKMIRDLRLKKGENIVASKRYTKEIAEKELLCDDNSTLTPEGKVVFEEIFNEYA
jgi:ubiquitin carboxyl-terminal hydrolase 34